jgi:hypothetical protein
MDDDEVGVIVEEWGHSLIIVESRVSVVGAMAPSTESGLGVVNSASCARMIIAMSKGPTYLVMIKPDLGRALLLVDDRNDGQRLPELSSLD